MMRSAVVLILLLAATAGAQCPTIGSLCDGVPADPDSADFWAKWNAADAVVYGTAWTFPSVPCIDSSEDYSLIGPCSGPQTIRGCGFILTPATVWKGPADFGTVEAVSTSWSLLRLETDPQIPENPCHWQNEPCTLAVGGTGVYFLKSLGANWETYRCFGTEVYDLSWLLAEVGTPVAAEGATWGAIKAMYR